VSILQNRALLESDLWLIALNFLALLFTEESKFKVELQGQMPENVFFVTDILDREPRSGTVA